jgi:hypothetical protein
MRELMTPTTSFQILVQMFNNILMFFICLDLYKNHTCEHMSVEHGVYMHAYN